MMNTVKTYRLRGQVILAAFGVLALASCDTLVYGGNPTQMTTGGVETYRDQFAFEKETSAINDADIARISRDYWARGDGALQLMVTYDPQSKTNTASKAEGDAERLAGLLRAKSVKDIDATIMPVMASGSRSMTLIGYSALNAAPPSECRETLNMDFADQNIGEDYRLGCSVHSYVARQVARPKDLLGRGDMDNGDGRMLSNALEPYMGGMPNPELKGETASE